MSFEFVDLCQADIEVSIPDFNGELHTCKVHWIRNIAGDFYEVSLKGIRYPFDAGFTTWLCKITDQSITPISCTLYFDGEECKLLNWASKLNFDSKELRDRILKQRIENYG